VAESKQGKRIYSQAGLINKIKIDFSSANRYDEEEQGTTRVPLFFFISPG